MQSELTVARALALLLAMSLIVAGDTAGKLLTAAGLHPFFVAWARFALGSVLVVPFCGLQRNEWRGLLDWRVILRAALLAVAICCILTALRTEPIANVFGAFFIGPLVAYGLSILLLGERASLLRSVFLLLGFGGVLLVVRPSADMGVGALFALMAGVLFGAMLVATRWLAPLFRPRFLLASQLLIGSALLAPLGLGLGALTAQVTPGIAGLLVISALASAGGNYLIVTINRSVPTTLSAPFVYSQLIAATGFGIAVFGDWPDFMTLAGLSIILLSGLAGGLLSWRKIG